jgi:hypothetical protein
LTRWNYLFFSPLLLDEETRQQRLLKRERKRERTWRWIFWSNYLRKEKKWRMEKLKKKLKSNRRKRQRKNGWNTRASSAVIISAVIEKPTINTDKYPRNRSISIRFSSA